MSDSGNTKDDSDIPKKFGFRHRRRCEKGNGPVLINCIPSKTTIQIDNEGKIYKQIIMQGDGDGDEIPHNGVEISVNYSGFLADMSVFGTTDGKEPYKFILGDEKARVVKGWHLGIPTMKKGEIAHLVIHPDYGYGPDGYQNTIPGNATIYFEIELLGWEGENISPDGGREVLRKRIREGPNKHAVPNDGATIKIALDGSFDGKMFDKREVTFSLGEGEDYNICPGVEQALYKFVDKEISRLTISSAQAFGCSGNKEFGIPPNATVTYVVELQSIKRAKEVWEMFGQEKLELSRIFKTRAINYFKQSKYRLSAKFYKRITNYLTAEAMLEGDDESERRNLMYIGHLNQSLCYLKLNENLKALHSAEEVLKFEPLCEKGLFRKGLAHLALQEPVAAKTDFEELLKLVPTNKAAQQQLQISIRKIKENKEQDRIIYAKMFDAFSTKEKSPNILTGTHARTAPA